MGRVINCRVWFDWDFNGTYTDESANLVSASGDTRFAPPEALVGSPPRVWGIRCQAAAAVSPRRFTPTRVGNTANLRLSARPDHGSPPRVWGIPVPQRCHA